MSLIIEIILIVLIALYGPTKIFKSITRNPYSEETSDSTSRKPHRNNQVNTSPGFDDLLNMDWKYGGE